MMRWTFAVLALVAGAVSYGVVQQARQSSRIAELSADLRNLQVTAAQPTAPAAPVTLGAAEREMLVQMLAARLAASIPAAHSAPAPAQAQPAPKREEQPPEPSDAARAAVAESGRVLDGVFSRGTLRRDDVLELRRLFAQAGPAADDLRRRIAVAINLGEFTPGDPVAGLP